MYSNVRYLSVDAINFKNELCYYGEEVDDVPLIKDDFIDLDDDAKTNEIIKTIIAILVALGVIGSGSVIIINKAKPSKSDPEPNNGNGPSPSLGKWVKFDEDYDLIATDPVTGEERVFVDKGNGLYTEPVSGISYTQEELVKQMDSREENKALIQQDLDQTKQAIDDHRKQNKELSEIWQKLKAEQDKINQERAYENYVRSVGNKLGMYDASEKEIRDALADKIIKEDKFRQEIHKAIEKMDTFIAGAETIVIASDAVMTYGEVFGGAAGKAVSATYKGTKGLAVNLAEKGISVSSVSEGLTKGATDAAGTIMKPGVGKATVVIGGTISSELITNPKDIGMAINTGIIKGITNVSIGTPSDVAGVTGNKGIEFLIKLQEDKIKKGMSDLVDQAAEQVIKEELAKQKK